MTGTTKRTGRPRIDWSQRLEHAFNYALLGATNEQIFRFLGLSESRAQRSKKAYPELASAIRRGRIMADAEIADSIFRKATGYRQTETTTREIRNPSGDLLSVETITITRDLPPDTDACIFWLSNRQPDKWRNRMELEYTESESSKADPDAAPNQDATP